MAEKDPAATPSAPSEQTAQPLPTFAEALSAAAAKSSLGRVKPGETPTAGALLGAMGGIRGLVESILPGLLFLVIYTISQSLLLSVLVPAAVAVIFVVVRLVTRQPVTSAIAGALGIAISAVLALVTGRAEDNFVPGFFINGGLVLVMVVSLIVRWPLIGVIVGFLTGESGWRTDKAKFRVAVIATVLWALLPAARLAVELPLWSLGLAQALAAVKLVMGVPLYAALLWVTWLLVRTAYTKPAEAQTAQNDAQ